MRGRLVVRRQPGLYGGGLKEKAWFVLVVRSFHHGAQYGQGFSLALLDEGFQKSLTRDQLPSSSKSIVASVWSDSVWRASSQAFG